MTARPKNGVREVASRAQWAAALTALRAQADLSIRELSRRTEIPSATLGGWFSGRNLPQAGQLAAFATALRECGLDDEQVERWTESVRRLRTLPSATSGAPSDTVSSAAGGTVRPPSPYPGLASFGVDDAAVFFGRGTETAEIVSRLSALREAGTDDRPGRGMLAVVGPSGSGKSSLLRAGVAAALAARSDERWTCVVMTPGADPDDALSEALARFGPGTRALVVDQFEEVFTAVGDPAVRAAFLARLAALPGAADPTLVVLGVRADFYAAAVGEPILVPVLQRAQFVLGPLGRDALRQAVTGPATAVGVAVEDTLVDLVLADATPRGATGEAHDAGALPLLSHALLSAWGRGSGGTLTAADYRAAGGLDGAVQHTAEDAWTALDAAGRAVARSLFLRLVHLGDDITDAVALTRRRVSGAELAALQDGDATAVRAVVDEFVARRLLTAGDATIEISHEALLSAWPRLRGWIDADRAALRLHRTVTEAANAWAQADRDEALLLRGGRLEAAAELSAHPSARGDLNQLEHDYVQAGIRAELTARDVTRRRTGRLRRAFAAVAVLAVVAGLLAIYSASARSDAEQAERAARVARNEALSGQLAIESRQLADRDPALAQQLALASYRIAPTAEARAALVDFSVRPIVARLLGEQGRTPMALAPGPAGLAASGQAGGDVRLLRVAGARPRVMATLPAPTAGRPVTALAFAPDADTLFVLDAGGNLVVWDVSRPATPRHESTTPLGKGFDPAAVGVAPDGDSVLVGGSGRDPLRRFDVRDPARPARVAAPAGLPAGITLNAVAQSPDGRWTAAGGDVGKVFVWDSTRPGSAPRATPTGANRQLAVLFGRGRLYVGDTEGAATAVDPATGRVLGVAKVRDAGWAQTLTLTADGTTLGVGSDDSTFREFSTSTFALRSQRRTPKEVVSAAYLPDGSAVVLSCVDGATYVAARRRNVVPTPSTTYNLSFDRRGDRVLASSGGGARVWDVRGRVPRAVTPMIAMTSTQDPATGGGALSPDGRLAALNNYVGQVQLFDLTDPARPRPWAAPFQAADELVESLSMSPRGGLLAMGSDDGSVSVWDVDRPATPRVLSRVRGADTFYDVAWSRDATMLAAAGADAAVYLWSVRDPRHPVLRAKLPVPADDVGGVAFSHDGRLLAASGSDGQTRLWDLDGAQRPRPHGRSLVGPTDFANGLSFSPDDTRLAVSSADSTVRIYDLDSSLRTPAATLEGTGGPAYSAQFTPDGTRLVASGRSGTAPVWTIDPAAAVRELCAGGGTVLTRAEWSQYVPGARYDPPCR